MALLTKDTLKDLGIDKIGHQVKILNQINKLKQNNNNDVMLSEGGTD